MTGELAPRPEKSPTLRLSDADRERAVEQLHGAVGEGRLTFTEFEQRVDGVLAARTEADLEPFFADLPTPPTHSAPREVAELRNTASNVRRRGRWDVPRRLIVRNKAGSAKLDFTSASFASTVVDVELDLTASSVLLVVPAGGSVDTDAVELSASSIASKVPSAPSGGVHFRVVGTVRASNVKVRHQRRFLRWTW